MQRAVDRLAVLDKRNRLQERYLATLPIFMEVRERDHAAVVFAANP